MMRRKRFASAALATLLALTMTACGGDSSTPTNDEGSGSDAGGTPEYTIKVGHTLQEDTPAHKAWLLFEEQVEANSEGRIAVELYPNSSLGTERVMFEACQMGTLEVAYGTTSVLANFDKNMEVLDLPFLFEDEATARAAITGELGTAAAANLGDIGLINLTYMENGIRHVTRILESMPKVGATILNGVSYAGWQALPDHGITLDEKRRKEELALESMSQLMKVAEDCGVLYCCEVVNRFEQYLLNTAKEGVEFVKRLGSPNARVLLDTFHMNIEEDSMVDAILEAGPWLGHFHVGENNRRPAGSTNRLPWKDMAAALKQVNYQGAIVMEPFVLMGGTIPYDIKVWRDLSGGAGEAGLDEMAGRACRFLKELTA